MTVQRIPPFKGIPGHLLPNCTVLHRSAP